MLSNENIYRKDHHCVAVVGCWVLGSRGWRENSITRWRQDGLVQVVRKNPIAFHFRKDPNIQNPETHAIIHHHHFRFSFFSFGFTREQWYLLVGPALPFYRFIVPRPLCFPILEEFLREERFWLLVL